MPDKQMIQFHDAMLEIYRRAKSEAKYNAIRYLQMVVDNGGFETARTLIHADNVSDGYTALWERGRLDLTVEAMIIDTPRFHSLFSEDELAICRKRLDDYEYKG